MCWISSVLSDQRRDYRERGESRAMAQHDIRVCVCVCVFITAVPVTKLFAWGGGGARWRTDVLREMTSRGLCGLVCPSRTSERGGEGYCVKEGGGEEGERERERAAE